MSTKWSALRKGQTIVCPKDGRNERVHSVRKSGHGRVHVRTSRHDHITLATNEVEVTQ